MARLCPNTTGAELRSVCTEAGMFAIRGRRKAIPEKDLIQAIDKVIKGYKKFSATGKYMVYNWEFSDLRILILITKYLLLIHICMDMFNLSFQSTIVIIYKVINSI